MKRDIIKTSDGSTTLSSAFWPESFHSINGALTESQHIYVQNGLQRFLLNQEELSLNQERVSPNQERVINIFEVGFGTALNAIATLNFIQNLKEPPHINYCSIEKHPLQIEQLLSLQHKELFPKSLNNKIDKIYNSPWNINVEIESNFFLTKIEGDIEIPSSYTKYLPKNDIDIIYFDPFSPKSQPTLWEATIFEQLCSMMANNSLLVTYSAKGSVKRALAATGFKVIKAEGPPGKRDIVIAKKN